MNKGLILRNPLQDCINCMRQVSDLNEREQKMVLRANGSGELECKILEQKRVG